MDDRDLIAQLLKGETHLSPQVVNGILERGPDIAEYLEQLICNIRLWHTDMTGQIAVFHSVKLLGALQYSSAVEALSNAIFLAYETANGDVLEELPLAFARIGKDGTASLVSILEDKKLNPAVRTVAASGLEGIAVLDEAETDKILDVFRHLLAEPEGPVELHNHVLNLLVHFRRSEDLPLITSVLSARPINMDIGESEIADYLEESAEPWEWTQYRLDPLEFYEDELA